MKLIEQIPLSNGLVAEVYDLSRTIAADTSKIEMVIKIKVTLRPDYFADPAHFEQTRKIFGTDIFYEYRMGQSFVKNEEKEQVFGALLESFKKGSLPYLSGGKFPGRLALSKYHDILKHPYKYYGVQTEQA